MRTKREEMRQTAVCRSMNSPHPPTSGTVLGNLICRTIVSIQSLLHYDTYVLLACARYNHLFDYVSCNLWMSCILSMLNLQCSCDVIHLSVTCIVSNTAYHCHPSSLDMWNDESYIRLSQITIKRTIQNRE